MKEYHYKCPYEETCVAHKHCHVLKTPVRLRSSLQVLVKCPARQNQEIVVSIGETTTK